MIGQRIALKTKSGVPSSSIELTDIEQLSRALDL